MLVIMAAAYVWAGFHPSTTFPPVVGTILQAALPLWLPVDSAQANIC